MTRFTSVHGTVKPRGRQPIPERIGLPSPRRSRSFRPYQKPAELDGHFQHSSDSSFADSSFSLTQFSADNLFRKAERQRHPAPPSPVITVTPGAE